MRLTLIVVLKRIKLEIFLFYKHHSIIGLDLNSKKTFHDVAFIRWLE